MNHLTDEQLIAYANPQIVTSARSLAEQHLAECAICQAELVAMQQTLTTMNDAGRAMQRMPVHTHRGWADVRKRLHTPLAVRVRQASGRFSLQAMMSLAVVVMFVLSGVSINVARASTPSVPFIQTPGTASQVLTDDVDTPTLSVTQALSDFETPTLTPIPGVNN